MSYNRPNYSAIVLLYYFFVSRVWHFYAQTEIKASHSGEREIKECFTMHVGDRMG